MPTVGINAPKTPVTKGSGGIAMATLPNICKMPGPPAPFVPVPLPNIGTSDNGPKGYSTSVQIEGNPVAIQGSSFLSKGDVASMGTGGGIVSSNVQGPTTFIGPGSLDVKIESKNVQLLGDPMLNNCGPPGSPANAATMAGVLQGILPPGATADMVPELTTYCIAVCECDANPPIGAAGQELKQDCVSDKMKARDDDADNRTTIKAEINYDMTQSPPVPIMTRSNPGGGPRGTTRLSTRTKEIPNFKPRTGMVRRPDAVIVRNGNLFPTQDNLRAVIENKFPPDPPDIDQILDYKKIAGPGVPVIELSPEACGCPEPEPEPLPLPKLSPWEITLLLLALAGMVADDFVGGEADDVLIPGVLGKLAGAL
jgi:hypothetical protein